MTDMQDKKLIARKNGKRDGQWIILQWNEGEFMNNIPKLKFKYLTLEETSDILSWMLKDTDNILSVKEGTLFLYPELKRLTKEDNIKDIIQDRYNNFIKENNNLREEYTTIWNEYNDKYMLEISNYFNIKWPKEYKEISVGIGLIPVCPRYIKEKAFDIHKKNKEDLIDTCMHELCHFLFFENVKKYIQIGSMKILIAQVCYGT